jgi:hypothetical protein
MLARRGRGIAGFFQEKGGGSNLETRMTKLTQRLFLVVALKANLGGCRQRAPYPLRPTRKNGQGKTGADGEL